MTAAPLFPENYNLSTPKRKEKRNLLFQRAVDPPDQQNLMGVEHDRAASRQERRSQPDGDGKVIEEPEADESSDYYLTMHPLNNVKLRAPKSILSAGPNQV